MQIFKLLYISTETRPTTDSDVISILEASRRNNPELGVTGLLLYRVGYFLQLLEGVEPEVIKLFQHLKKDGRHSACDILSQFSGENRIFPKWSMGYIESKSDNAIFSLFEHMEMIRGKSSANKDKVLEIMKRFAKS